MTTTEFMPPDWRPTVPSQATPRLRRRYTKPRQRKTPPTWLNWLVTLIVTALAAGLRLVGLSHPAGLIFDEVYYAQDGKTIWEYGVEWDLSTDEASYVAHPPLGKWIIGLGEQLFGYNEFGWRFASAIAGTLCVLILIRLLLRLTGSLTLAAVGGLFLAVEGSHVVLSRSALLDIFLAVLILLAFYLLVVDRQRQQSDALNQFSLDAQKFSGKPKSAVHAYKWRIAAAVCLGSAMSIKWSALWFIVAALIVIAIWDTQRGKELRIRRPWISPSLTVFWFGTVTVLVYLSTWAGWFANTNAWGRNWLAENGQNQLPILGDLANWINYHLSVYEFHSNLETEHSYQSTPWEWLFNLRPVVFYWTTDVPCDADKCAAEVILLGTPILWWAFVPATVGLLLWTIAKRDWRGGIVLAALAAGILPWLAFPSRTMFFFYSAPVVPFFIIAVVWMLGLFLSPRNASQHPERRLAGALIVGAYIAAVVLCFAYFWPLYTGQPIPYEEWQARLWLGSRWI